MNAGREGDAVTFVTGRSYLEECIYEPLGDIYLYTDQGIVDHYILDYLFVLRPRTLSVAQARTWGPTRATVRTIE